MQLNLIKTNLLEKYIEQVFDFSQEFNALKETKISSENFSFYTSVSSVFSSKIEGEEIDLDNYLKHKYLGIKFQPNYTKKIDDLYDSYIFAKNNQLNKKI